MIEDDGDYGSPVDVVPEYETDLSAVGTNRHADPFAPDASTPWWEMFDPVVLREVDLPEDVRVRP